MKKLKYRFKLSFLYIFLLSMGILSISLGYSTFHTSMNIDESKYWVRLNRNIRVTETEPASLNNAVSYYDEWNEHTLSYRFNLNNKTSSITYKVQITNFDNISYGIYDIYNLPSELTYTITGYNLKTKMCEGSLCANGMQKDIYITFKYANQSISHTNTDFQLQLEIDFRPYVTVTFNPTTGGSVTPTTKDVMVGYVYGDLPTPTKTGWYFTGWTYNGNTVTSSTINNNSTDHTLVATYIPEDYDVTFNANGGTLPAGTVNPKTLKYAQKYGTLPTPTKAGYDFVGWYTTSTFTDGTMVTSDSLLLIASNHTLYAKWEPGKFTVTFDKNGGNCSTASKIVTYDETYGTLPTASKTGHTFEGWWTDPTAGTQVTASTVVNLTADQILYAHYHNTNPTTPTMSLSFANGKILNAATNTETVTVSVYGSTDVEDSTLTYTISASTAYSVTSLGNDKWQVVYNSTGYHTIIAYATDSGGGQGVKTETFRINGSSSTGGTTSGQFVGTSFDSGWSPIMENLYISAWTFNLKIPSGHSNSTDTMDVYVQYKDGTVENIKTFYGNLSSTQWSWSGTFSTEQSTRVPVAIKFSAYSPHTGCVTGATITYSFDYTYDTSIT